MTDSTHVPGVVGSRIEGSRTRTAVPHALGERVVQYANIEPEPPTFESDQNVGAE